MFVDSFSGSNEKLLGSIKSLLSLDATGALAPHGIGGLARQLLSSAAARLATPPLPAGFVAVPRELGAAYPSEDHGCVYEDGDGPCRECCDLAALTRNATHPAEASVQDMHPATRGLVQRFAQALTEKLAAAERKYGYTDGWQRSDWMDECRANLVEHVAKGDPRDVAAYCAFLWHHGEPTAIPDAPIFATPAPPAAPERAEPQVPDDSEVICPACCHQFRAIPVQVQSLLLAAGIEPPFLTPQAAAQGEAVAWQRDSGDPDDEAFVISDRVRSLWLAANPQRVERYTIPLGVIHSAVANCNCPGKLSQKPLSHAPNCPARAALTAPPAPADLVARLRGLARYDVDCDGGIYKVNDGKLVAYDELRDALAGVKA